MNEVTFFVSGTPAPGGSKKAFPFKKKGGGIGVAVTDAGGKKTKEWRKAVAWAAKTQKKKLNGPLSASFIFCLKRPKSHFNSSCNLKHSAPKHPTVRPDVTKLVRSTEDAMTGIIYDDDAQIIDQRARKVYLSANEGCEIRIQEMQ